MRPIESWISDDELNTIYSSEYWNDIAEEKKKAWWIEDGNYEKCLEFLEKSNLLYEYKRSEELISNLPNKSLKVVDLAAGIGWTSALISKLSEVTEVHAVEISRHRLESLFKHCNKMLSGNEDKIYRYLGSFYDLKFEDNSMDVVYLSQAFHHAQKPLKLLIECDRVLKKDGRIILVGEHYIGYKSMFKKFVLKLLKERTFTTNFYDLFPSDEALGDHYYRCSDYYFLFKSLGYDIHHNHVSKRNVIYFADKKG